MVPIIFKDIDAICIPRRKYVSDDFPLIGYNATFRRYVGTGGTDPCDTVDVIRSGELW